VSNAEDPLGWIDSQPRRPAPSRGAFHEQLDEVDSEIVAVATIVAELIRPVTAAFLAGDRPAAAAALTADAEVDQRCERLEEQCFELLARQSPVAGDLRRLVAALRAAADVDRSAELLGHVAESLSWVHPPSMRPALREMVGQMGGVTADVFAGAVAAWRDTDALAAVDLQRLDDQVDLLQKTVLTELYLGGQTVEEAVSLALICRYYERIADHAVELARLVTYVVTGERPEEG